MKRVLLGTRRAGLLLSALLVVFLWEPLTGGGYYTGVDILQHFPMFMVQPPHSPKNNLIGDTVLVMFPAASWNVEEVRQGRFPLWNPYNGWGVPHFAGFQSGVFSPYTLPYYVMSFRHALIAAAFLKLFGFGLFTYLFLRRRGCGPGPAMVGAVAFMFGGYNVLWLHYPLSSAMLVLPAGMYAAEVVLSIPLREGQRRALALAGFTLALTAGLMAGHPETYFFGSVLLGGWLAYRVAGDPGGVRGAARRVAELAACGLAALALCAVQLLPFFEYVRQSSTFAERTGHGGIFFVLFARLVPLQFFPNLLGKPGLPFADLETLIRINYIEANTSYVGLTALCLAGWAVLTLARHRSRDVMFFAAGAALWVAYAYDVAGIGRLMSKVPIFSMTVPNRSQGVWIFCVACLAALALEQTASGRIDRGSPRRLALAAGAWGGFVLLVALGAAARLYLVVETRAQELGAWLMPRIHAETHVAFVSLSFALGVAGLVLLALDRGPRRRWATAALIASVFLQSGVLLRGFNHTIDRRYFYPLTPPLRRLAATAGEQALFADGAWIPANTNLWYRIRSAWHYDGMGVFRIDDLRSRLLGTGASNFNTVTLRGLQLLGIRRVLSTRAKPFGDRVPPLPREWTEGTITSYAVPDARPRFYTVGHARAATRDEDALNIMMNAAFDPGRSVVLDLAAEPPLAPVDGAGEVAVVEDTPTRARLRVNRTGPGWLVVMQAHLPGWSATVNGEPRPLTRANIAFSAVALDAGASEVVLRYRPASFRLGGAISGVAAIALGGGTIGLVRARRRRAAPA